MSVALNRKSVRQFKDKMVSESKIDAMLKAAMQAPSANNQQPWNFIVVTDRTLLDKLSIMSKGSWPLQTAPLAIIPVIIPTSKSPRMRVQDISAATQNILLEAVEQNLGGVWMGVYPIEERVEFVTSVLEISGENIPFCIIALGVPQQKKDVVVRYDESRIHNNTWNK